jgi:hypothetical protein
MIAGDIAIAAVGDHAGHATELIPDRRPFAIGVRRAFDLKCAGRHAPHEVARKAPAKLGYR